MSRARALRPDGSPKYINRLFFESSPYLLQHAHNPVNWYPWGDEAFDTARRLGRPVLLSVGYSTCHWCHVMEEESFDDEEIARYINENYVIVKVDREERPDIDAIYMSAVQALTGSGGWPMIREARGLQVCSRRAGGLALLAVGGGPSEALRRLLDSAAF